MNLSRPNGSCVNDGISNSDFPLSSCSVDDAASLLVAADEGAYMAKFDVPHAFRLVPVRPQNWPLLGYKCKDIRFLDVAIFKGRSLLHLYCLLSKAGRWILYTFSTHKVFFGLLRRFSVRIKIRFTLQFLG